LDRDSGFVFEVEGAKKEWEKRVILELYDEYAYILRERRLGLKACAITLTDSDSFWAQWNPTTRTILFSRKLIENHNWFQVLSILRHEMAHQLLDESYIPGSMEYRSHGEPFQIGCRILGVPEEYTGATACLQSSSLDWRSEKRDDITEKLLEKVRKLLSLATSSNEHEALLAMNKVRELYAKYNLDEAEGSRKQRFAHLVITHGKKRIEAHQSRTTSILVEHFFVQVITTKIFDAKSLEHHVGIEIVGTRENVMMAEYVYHFLIQQTDYLVSEIAKTKPLSRVQRKSYKLGALAGFSEKLRETERAKTINDSLSPNTGPGLIRLALAKFHRDTVLDRYLNNIYPRLSSNRGSSQYVDGSAFSQGQSVGRTITLNKAVNSSNENRGQLLSE
jgi:hypothetical protein